MNSLCSVGGGDGCKEIMAYLEILDLFHAKQTADEEDANRWIYQKFWTTVRDPVERWKILCCGKMISRPCNLFYL